MKFEVGEKVMHVRNIDIHGIVEVVEGGNNWEVEVKLHTGERKTFHEADLMALPTPISSKMKFKVGDCVSVDTARLKNPAIGFITYATTAPLGPIYNISLQNHPGIGAIMGVSEDDITLLVREVEKTKQLKMTLALEETLKEISKHLDDDSLSLIESVVKHDYHQKTKNHYITLDIVLKENK